MFSFLKCHAQESHFHFMEMKEQSPVHFRERTLTGCLKDGWEGGDIAFIRLTNIYQTSTTFQTSCWKEAVQRHVLALRETSPISRGDRGGNI